MVDFCFNVEDSKKGLMAWPKKDPLDRHKPCAFSITLRTKILFEEKCKSLGFNRSEVAEELFLNFINNG